MSDDHIKGSSKEALGFAAQSNLPGAPLLSSHLFGTKKEIVIIHDGEEYRLRITRNNKLILTK
jgi:hemin uptake protein HemP